MFDRVLAFLFVVLFTSSCGNKGISTEGSSSYSTNRETASVTNGGSCGSSFESDARQMLRTMQAGSIKNDECPQSFRRLSSSR